MAIKERWAAIAADVEGKTQKQCVDRFKFLRKKAQAEQERRDTAAARAEQQVCLPDAMLSTPCVL